MGHGMLRRSLLMAGAAAAMATPAASWAQQMERVYRVGFVVQPQKQDFAAMFDELERHGFGEGKNLAIDPRGFGIPDDSLHEAAVRAVAAKPDVIYAGGVPAGRALQQLTRTIPLVVTAYDMVQAHLAASLAHPGGNITGVSILATELDGKRLGILIEILPGIRRIAALVDPATASAEQVEELADEAGKRGIKLSVHRVATAEQISPAIVAAQDGGAEALTVLASAMFQAYRAAIFAEAAERRLPAIYQWPEWGREGALICYGPRITSIYRQAARQIAKILDDPRRTDIPVEQPTTFELTINLKTAKALGLSVPQMLLARADEVIE